jgi:hypothetical protein
MRSATFHGRLTARSYAGPCGLLYVRRRFRHFWNHLRRAVVNAGSARRRSASRHPRQAVIGSVAVLGELVQTAAGKWITHPPTRCPNGHPLGPSQVLVGHVACLGHGGGGHTSWHCPTCDAVLYGPPMNSHCTALEGVYNPHGGATCRPSGSRRGCVRRRGGPRGVHGAVRSQPLLPGVGTIDSAANVDQLRRR